MPASVPDTEKPAKEPQVQYGLTRTTRLRRYCGMLAVGLTFLTAALAQNPVWIEVELPAHQDPFAPDATAQYSAAANAACAIPRPAELMGYRWQLPAFAAELRQQNGDAPGKQIYVAFLKSKYGYQIAKLNADYGTDAQSFTELLELPMPRGVPAQDAEFDAPIRKELSAVLMAALRQCDPQHADGFLRFLIARI